jgi:hypothetical protein
LPSLFETSRRLPTSATALDVRATKPGLFDSRRDGGLDLLPFLTRHALSLAEAVTRGEPRSVRPSRPQCWFLPVPRVCPTVMPTRAPHHPKACARGCVVRIDVHGSKDRVKDVSSEHTYDLSCVCRVHTLCGACRRRSPPRRPSDIRCHRCAAARGGPRVAGGPT